MKKPIPGTLLLTRKAVSEYDKPKPRTTLPEGARITEPDCLRKSAPKQFNLNNLGRLFGPRSEPVKKADKPDPLKGLRLDRIFKAKGPATVRAEAGRARPSTTPTPVTPSQPIPQEAAKPVTAVKRDMKPEPVQAQATKINPALAAAVTPFAWATRNRFGARLW